MNKVYFSCPKCRLILLPNTIDNVDADADRCTMFRQKVFHSRNDKPFVEANCPKCSARILQCRHCSKSISAITNKSQQRSAQQIMQRHYEQAHTNKYKRPKLNEPETSDCMEVDDFSTNNEQLMQDDNVDDDDKNEEYDDKNGEDCYSSDEEEENEIQLSEVDQWIQQAANALLEDEERKQLEEIINMEELEKYIPYLNEMTDGNGEEEDGSPMSGDSNGQCNYDSGRFKFEEFQIFTEESDTKYINGDKSKPRINQNQAYFYSEHAHGAGGGWRRNVGLSNVGDRERIDNIANKEEAEAMFHMVKFLFPLSENKRNEYCTAQAKMDHVKQPQNLSTDTEFPTDKNVMNRKIFKGKNSIVANMPHPQVKLRDDHATVGLIETIRHSLGHGAKFNFAFNGAKPTERNKEGLNGTKAMDELINDVNSRHQEMNSEAKLDRTKIGYLLFWSDSFLRCFIKQKENSVWILTVTVCPPEDDKSSSLYTYVLAMGRSDLDHTPIIKRVMNEVHAAMNGFECFDGSNDSFQRVAFGMIAWNADRPERQSLTGQRKEGLNGLVNGWAAAPNQKIFASCIKCYIRLMKEATENNPVTPCEDKACCNFMFFDGASEDGNQSDENKIHYNNMTSDAYPTTYVDPEMFLNNSYTEVPPCRAIGMKYLSPIKLTRDLATTLVKVAYTGVVLGQWTSANFKEYLTTCNISGALVDSLYKQAETDREECRYNPKSVEQDIWNLFDCFGFLFPNLPMHGLCHGMIPDVLDIVLRIFGKYKKGGDFIKYANMILSEISKLGLSYCKVKKLPKAAWVAENSMAFMRLMSYLFGSYLAEHPLGSSDNDKKVTMHIMCMLNAFQRLVSLLMSMRTVPKETIDNSMRLFMASAHYLNEVHGVLSDKKHKVPKGERFVEKVDIAVLKSIAKKLKVDNDKWNGNTQKSTIINKIRSIKNEDLLTFLTAADQKKYKDYVKDELIKEIYIKMCSDGECDQSGLDAAREQRSTQYFYCWYKGNWLSFLATIANQVEILGQLQLIW